MANSNSNSNRVVCVLAVLLLVSCERVENFVAGTEPASPHSAYAEALRQAGLDDTALGREWLAAGDAALRTPIQVTLPVQEAGYFPGDRPRAVAYRVNLVRGRRLSVQAEFTPHPGALLFIDVFGAPESEGDSLRHVASADSALRSLEFEPRRTGDYIIRIQSELLRGGRYVLTMRTDPALAFPVQGRANAAIQSGFGAPRDGGARDHHGLDIFAPRGTPVLSAAEGVVTRVQETARGGRVVWVRDERRGNSLYYAHLDRQLVERGQTVAIGDTIGLVGNTGNARSTPPHLHFGIYRRGEGPTDPRPWIAIINARPAPLRADTTLLGDFARTRSTTPLLAAASPQAATVRELEAETIVRVLGAQGSWFQVTLPNGVNGFVAATGIVASRPLRQQDVKPGTELRAQPTDYAALIDTVGNTRAQVFGRFDRYLYVAVDTLVGWIRAGDQ
jgi:murein DD-endopeptidase MepM/ murein hydrolase activator NlpD